MSRPPAIPQTALSASKGADAADECALCGSAAAPFHRVSNRAMRRDFVHCGACDLVSVPPRFHVGREAERQRYLEHDNDPNDPDYRAFLARLWDHLRPLVEPGAKVLDYGAGPGPALAAMMGEDGFEVSLYDKHFHPDRTTLASSYDFIVCTETVEHFDRPAYDFGVLDGLLRPSGWLGIMTEMPDDWAGFPEWRYHRDPTHVAFYTQRTMRWIAARHGWQATFPRRNVVLFRKPS